MNLKITTWNILADAYMRRHHKPAASPTEPFSCRPVNVDNRRELMLETIAKQSSDIYALQEVEPDAFNAIEKLLAKTHTGSLVQKKDKPEGCALFVRTSLNPVFSELRYKNINDGKNQVAALVDVTCDGQSVGIASTHLQWMKQSATADGHLGRLQLVELMDHVQTLARPFILCGDLNANSQSVVIDAARERGYVLSCRNQRPWDTTNINGRCRKIDYLLCLNEAGFDFNPSELVKLSRDTPMPSKIHASDHLPVTVQFSK